MRQSPRSTQSTPQTHTDRRQAEATGSAARYQRLYGRPSTPDLDMIDANEALTFEMPSDGL